MKHFILFDDRWSDLLPLTFTRPVADLRVGILTIREKWERYLQSSASFFTEPYLREKFPAIIGEDNYFINGSVLPDESLVNAMLALSEGEYLVKANTILAARLGETAAANFSNDIAHAEHIITYSAEVLQIRYTYDIFMLNGKALERDFKMLTQGRTSVPLSSSNGIIGGENIFVEEGARVEYAIINASTGPVYIGRGAEIMEGCMIRGPLALCDHAQLKMGAKIYGPTTIGPNCRVGGEVQNVVIWGNSNKAHDGFLGNAVLGEWCNIGADSNNSNLKNNYSEVKLWNYTAEKFLPTGLQFCGLIMGDHSKCGINTMFNTGTVVGVSANIFGAGYPRNFIPSFSWGGYQGLSVYPLQKAFETAEKVMLRRNQQFTEVDKRILQHIYMITEKYRRF
ncbi:MAG TPA: GlmU family protein [Bacteroidales bacterium]|nr:GlmU family protein [Bacteroidales bacterium]HOK97848.1 GlmU family protein [Bacteroidales bacterium]HPO64613.1 GlmU family protein [Bacteroidales bacterium]